MPAVEWTPGEYLAQSQSTLAKAAAAQLSGNRTSVLRIETETHVMIIT
jgi:hypothetical protein